RGNARTARAQAFAQRALGIQFDLQLAAKDELLEEFVLADVSGDHFLDLALLQQQADAEIVDARVVADNGKVFCAFAAHGGDQVLRNTTEAEATHENGCAVGKLGDGGVSGSDSLVHGVLSYRL